LIVEIVVFSLSRRSICEGGKSISGSQTNKEKAVDIIFSICHKQTMPRPLIQRQIGYCLNATHFKPQGVPMQQLETVELAKDELEAIRLTDLEGFYQEQAAEQMGVSRQTLGNILKRAHQKIAGALIDGKVIQLESCCPISPENRRARPGRCGRRRGHGRCGKKF
jgi:predicted DNA-binding protein (UPF0251 family)